MVAVSYIRVRKLDRSFEPSLYARMQCGVISFALFCAKSIRNHVK